MPIGREAERRYPGGSLRSAEWLAIRAAILERATITFFGGRQGDAVRVHGASAGAITPGTPASLCVAGPHPRRARPMPGALHEQVLTRSPARSVVLTVAHLDHDPGHNAPDNLRAMCQRCHNRYDMPRRRAHARLTRRARYATGDLFDAHPAPPRGDGGRL